MRSRFSYLCPASVKEALDALHLHRPGVKILAGGTDLLIEIRNGEMEAGYVVDVSRLPEMRAIEMRSGRLFIGAAASYTDIIRSELVQTHAPVLVRAARCVGSVQIRNAGTLGGNVANANPAGDSVPALVVHGAWAEVRSAGSTRRVRVEEVIVGANKTSLAPDELIVGFSLEPYDNGYACSWQRVARRRALSVARMSVAAVAKRGRNGVVEDLRLACGSVTPSPKRMIEAEEIVKGTVPDEPLIGVAAQAVSSEMIRVSGVRRTTEYKKPAIEGLVIKALRELFPAGKEGA